MKMYRWRTGSCEFFFRPRSPSAMHGHFLSPLSGLVFRFRPPIFKDLTTKYAYGCWLWALEKKRKKIKKKRQIFKSRFKANSRFSRWQVRIWVIYFLFTLMVSVRLLFLFVCFFALHYSGLPLLKLLNAASSFHFTFNYAFFFSRFGFKSALLVYKWSLIYVWCL